MILKTVIQNIRHKPLTSWLNIVLISTGVGIITMLGLLQQQFQNRFENNIKGIDMVLGASGSPLQLVLSAVYQMDAPTGNIPVSEAEKWMNSPLIKEAIPLAYGDFLKGFPIVGTTHDYATHYGAELGEGRRNEKDFEVVIGYEVAQKLKLSVGMEFHGTHGAGEHDEEHEHHHYKISGIFAKTGKIIDRLILTNIHSVWAMHEVEHEHGEDCEHHDEREYTAVLLKHKNPMARFQLPGLVRENSPALQIAIPAIEINRLMSMLGIGIKTMTYLAYLIMFISAISIFISLLNSLKERQYELAIMRAMGAGKKTLAALILIESLVYCLIGYVLGLLLGICGHLWVANFAEESYQFQLGFDMLNLTSVVLIGLSVIIIGIIAAVIPAIKAYTIDISKTLSND